MEDNSKKVVFCDMTSDSYEDVPQSDEIASLRGQWCGYQNSWTTASTVINYDKMFFQESNMNNTALDIETGETLIKHETSNNNLTWPRACQ